MPKNTKPPRRSLIVWTSMAFAAAALLVWFLLEEIPAALDSVPDNTLSEMVWWLRDHWGLWFQALVAVVTVLLFVIALWLVLHMNWGGENKADRWFQRQLRKVAMLFKRGDDA